MVTFTHRIGLLFVLAAGCAHPEAKSVWEYKRSDFSGYTTISSADAANLIRQAERDFRDSPAYPDDGPRPLSVTRVARRSDGTILIAFSIGLMSDTRAIYIFNPEGEIVDRYLHSFWGN